MLDKLMIYCLDFYSNSSTPTPIDSSPESSSRSSGIYSTNDLRLSDLSTSSSSSSSEFHTLILNGNTHSQLLSSSKFDFRRSRPSHISIDHADHYQEGARLCGD